MSKKILSIVLALALALSCFAVSAFAIGSIAYESDEDAALYNQAWALESTNSGNVYTVKVLLTADYDVGPIQFKVNKTVNKGTITLTNAVAGDAIPATWTADVSFSDTTGKVAVIPNPEETGAYGIANPNKACVAILTYTVSDDAAGSLVIDVADAKNADKPNGTLIAARMDDKNVVTSTAYTGQTVSQDTNTVTIGNASTPPTLAVVAGTIGVIDTSRTAVDDDNETLEPIAGGCTGYIYGVDYEDESEAYNSIAKVFKVVGDGTMNVVATDNGEGTGTIVEVLDLDGNVVAKYILIVFGDVNGDGYATTDDADLVSLHDSWIYGYNFDTWEADPNYPQGRMLPYQIFAADLANADGEATTDDADAISLHDAWIYGYNFDTWEPDANLPTGRFSQEYIINNL